MPKKVPLIRIGVQREGVTVYPEIGKPFDFTKEEVADITKLAENDKADYIRNPVNEDAAEAKPAAKAAAGGGKAGDTGNL